MFLSRALGQCIRSNARTGVRAAPGCTIRWLRPRIEACHPTRLPSLRLQQQSAKYAANASPAYRYPENLNIFNSGTAPTVAAGLVRIVCSAVCVIGVFYVAPSVFFEDGAPWYLVPLIAVGSAVPLIVSGVAFGGYIHHINILLPRAARRSKDDLNRFIVNVPPNAIIQVKSMWFRPWPVTKQIFFEDLRRLPRSKLRLSNLESTPPKNVEAADKNPMSAWLAKKIMGTYFVNNSITRDLSRAPGLWQKIWPQIPMSGERTTVKQGAEKIAILAANRPAPAPVKPRSSQGRPTDGEGSSGGKRPPPVQRTSRSRSAP